MSARRRSATDVHAPKDDDRGTWTRWEYRIVCGNGYHIWGVYESMQLGLIHKADMENRSGAPHRWQRRPLGEWQEVGSVPVPEDPVPPEVVQAARDAYAARKTD